MRLFWHIACMNNWRDVVIEQMRCLAGYPEEIQYCIGGTENDIRFVEDAAKLHGLRVMLLRMASITEFEFPTLLHLERYCRRVWTDPNEPIGYFHTKGVSRPQCEIGFYWRRLLNRGMLKQWPQAVERLNAGMSGSGNVWANWDGKWHYSGNFWWVKAGVVQGLPSLKSYRETWDKNCVPWEPSERFAAEMWIGAKPSGEYYSEMPGAKPSHWWWWENQPELRHGLMLE